MHPIERLRYVARAGADDLDGLAQEAASALRGFRGDHAGLVTACRSLVDRHPAAGPLWWLAARCLCSPDPGSEAWQAADELERDRTFATLVATLPEEAAVVSLGWPATLAAAARRRGDLSFLVVDPGGMWSWQLDRLVEEGNELAVVPEAGMGSAVATADLVLLEAQALGGDTFVAVAGARAAAATARHAGVPVWLVAPVGRCLPAQLMGALQGRLASARPWAEPDEIVPLKLVDLVIRSIGELEPADAAADPDCPFAPELLRSLDAPGTYR